MNTPGVVIKEVDPRSLGWKRRPELEGASDNPFETEPEIWEQPDGTLYRYQVRMDEYGQRIPFRIVLAALSPTGRETSGEET